MPSYSFEDDAPAAPAGKGYSFVDEPAPQPKAAPSAGSRVRAALSGLQRGVVDVAGLPVDTISNVLDLGRAGIGTLATAAGRADLAPDIPDRSTVVGSSDWLARKLGNSGLVSVAPERPDDAASRILFSGGRVAGGSLAPVRGMTAGQQAGNAAKGAVSGLISGGVGEVAPEWAGLAGMAPQLASAAVSRGTRRAIRGDEQGRQAMEQRMADLRAGGVENPSVGLASGNRTVQGLENMLAQTPGSLGLYARARDANTAGMRARTEGLRDSLASEYGPQVAGEAIQSSIKNDLVGRVKSNQAKLYSALDALVDPKSQTRVSNSATTLNRLTQTIEGAPNVGNRFINGRIRSINDALRVDTGLARSTAPDHISASQEPGIGFGAVGERGFAPPANPSLPYEAVAKLRSQVGAELADNSLVSDVPRSQWKQLYASLSDDVQGAAAAAGPQAQSAWKRANDYSRTGYGRIESLEGLAGRDTPEGAYKAVESSLRSGPTVYERLRGTLSPQARQQVVATVIDDLGGAPAGGQNASGDVWSPRTFLTNYNKMDAGARNALFTRLPGGGAMKDQLGKIAKTAELVGDSSAIWSNPSGTAPALVARGTLGTIAAGAVGGAFYTPLIAPAAIAGGGLLAANQVSKRLLLNPKFVNWLAKAPAAKTPEEVAAYSLRLTSAARLSNDQQFRDDVREYLQQANGSE